MLWKLGQPRSERRCRNHQHMLLLISKWQSLGEELSARSPQSPEKAPHPPRSSQVGWCHRGTRSPLAKTLAKQESKPPSLLHRWKSHSLERLQLAQGHTAGGGKGGNANEAWAAVRWPLHALTGPIRPGELRKHWSLR